MKGKKIVTITATSVAAGMVVLSGIMKLIRNEELVRKMNVVGVGQYITLFGMMEIAFAALYLYPRTMKVGFLLLTCYFAGAIATDLSHGLSIAAAVVVQVLVWVSAYLRDSLVFMPSAAAAQK